MKATPVRATPFAFDKVIVNVEGLPATIGFGLNFLVTPGLLGTSTTAVAGPSVLPLLMFVFALFE